MIFKKDKKSNKVIEQTVIKIKTVDDIPVIKEMRKMLGNGKVKDAIIFGYNSVLSDYIKSFYGSVKKNGSSREFIINQLNNLGIKVEPGEGLVNNNKLIEALNGIDVPDKKDNTKQNINQLYALKKLAVFYLNYYEPARYGIFDENINSEEIISKIKDVYNYMDIMALFYNDQQ